MPFRSDDAFSVMVNELFWQNISLVFSAWVTCYRRLELGYFVWMALPSVMVNELA